MPHASLEVCSGGEPEGVEKAVKGNLTAKPAVCNSLWESLAQPGENGHRSRVVMGDSTRGSEGSGAF